MSTERGNMRKRAPKHQNTFAFKHNPHSKKTKQIMSMPIYGLCHKCLQQIEWRKKYRKYKPRTQLGSCIFCHEKNVTSAYHAACDPCTKDRDICAKCCLTKEIVATEQELLMEHKKKQQTVDSALEGMRERERRAYVRQLQKENEVIGPNGEGATICKQCDMYESCDEDDEAEKRLLCTSS